MADIFDRVLKNRQSGSTTAVMEPRQPPPIGTMFDPNLIEQQSNDEVDIAADMGVSLAEARQIRADRDANEKNKKGTIDFWEAAGTDWEQKIPFSPVGFMESKHLFDATRRISSDDPDTAYLQLIKQRAESLSGIADEAYAATGVDPPLMPYSGPTVEELQKQDADMITAWAEEQSERAERGYSFGGKVGAGISILPAWMIEFAMTGGIKKLGSVTAKKFMRKAMHKHLTTHLAGAIGGAAARTTIGLPHRVAEGVLNRRIADDSENWATSVAKGWGSVFIEALSEEAGGAIAGSLGKAVSHLPFGGAFMNGIHKAWVSISPKNTTAVFLKKITTKAGYSNIIGEIGEERLATVLHAVVGTEDFGLGPDASTLDRLKEGLAQDIENFPVEAVVLAVPGAGRFVLGGLAGVGEGTESKTPTTVTEEGEATVTQKATPKPEPDVPKTDTTTEAAELFFPDRKTQNDIALFPEKGLEPTPDKLLVVEHATTQQWLDQFMQEGIDATQTPPDSRMGRLAIEEGTGNLSKSKITDAGIFVSPGGSSSSETAVIITKAGDVNLSLEAKGLGYKTGVQGLYGAEDAVLNKKIDTSEIAGIKKYNTETKKWEFIPNPNSPFADRISVSESGYIELNKKKVVAPKVPVDHKPVTGPKKKTSRLAKRTAHQAIQEGIEQEFGDLPEYAKMNMADQAEKANQLISDDPVTAYRVAMAMESPKGGLRAGSVFVALRTQALKNGNAGLIYDLSKSKLTQKMSKLGQEIKALDDRGMINPVKALQDIETIRTEAQSRKGRGFKAKQSESVKEMKQSIQESKSPVTAWKTFIDNLVC